MIKTWIQIILKLYIDICIIFHFFKVLAMLSKVMRNVKITKYLTLYMFVSFIEIFLLDTVKK